MTKSLPGAQKPVNVRILEGRQAVLSHAELLQALAERCQQCGAMHWLDYFFGGKGARWKRPCLVLFIEPFAERGALRPHELCAAMLFYQLAQFGLATGAFATDDWAGRRTVIAPPEIRSHVTAMAIEALFEHGAHVVLATYRHLPPDGPYGGPMLKRRGVLWAERSREIHQQQLTLGSTYEETLAKFGKQTRFNLRYYRRRLLAKMKCEFIADVCAVMSEQECTALNANSLNPVPSAECKRRYRASRTLPGGFLVGLRGPEGQWLSVLGGWRHGSTTMMRYQINSSGYRKDSLATVIRSFFLEHEVERGTRTIVFYHGTNHSTSSAFDVEHVRDLVVRRRSVRAWMLRKLAGRVVSPGYYMEAPYFRGSTSFFAATLTSRDMEWRATRAEV